MGPLSLRRSWGSSYRLCGRIRRRNAMYGRNLGEIRRFRPGRALAISMLLLYPDIFVNGAQTVRVRGQSAGSGATFRSLRSLGWRGHQGVGWRSHLGSGNLLMNALQDDQHFFHAALHSGWAKYKSL